MNEITKQNDSDILNDYLVHLGDTDTALRTSIRFLSRAIRLKPENEKDDQISLMKMRDEIDKCSQLIRDIIIRIEVRRI